MQHFLEIINIGATAFSAIGTVVLAFLTYLNIKDIRINKEKDLAMDMLSKVLTCTQYIHSFINKNRGYKEDYDIEILTNIYKKLEDSIKEVKKTLFLMPEEFIKIVEDLDAYVNNTLYPNIKLPLTEDRWLDLGKINTSHLFLEKEIKLNLQNVSKCKNFTLKKFKWEKYKFK